MKRPFGFWGRQNKHLYKKTWKYPPNEICIKWCIMLYAHTWKTHLTEISYLLELDNVKKVYIHIRTVDGNICVFVMVRRTGERVCRKKSRKEKHQNELKKWEKSERQKSNRTFGIRHTHSACTHTHKRTYKERDQHTHALASLTLSSPHKCKQTNRNLVWWAVIHRSSK